MLFLVCLLSFFLFSRPTYALPKFTTDYTIHYQVNSSGVTHVVFDIKQTNNLSQVYSTDFGLSVGQTNITNVLVTDIDRKINPDIVKTDNLTAISFPFVNKVVGRDKTHNFRIEYDTTDIAQKQGEIWEINIPKLENNEDINSQTTVLTVPSGFPSVAYIDPQPTTIDNNTYYFSGAAVNKPISALFGQTQYYQIDIDYYLDNPSITKNTKEISLPPDTSYQKVFIKSIEPQPQNITTDINGNWLAQYELGPQKKLKIHLTEIVKLNFLPAKQKLENSEVFLSNTDFWNYQSDIFNQTQFTSLNTAEDIFNFVISHLNYNFTQIGNSHKRLGAVYAIQNPNQSICTEFTDLFVTLARKKHIPSREIQGYALSSNDVLRPINLEKDILHSWPEYYSNEQQTWIQVDPTWTQTTNGINYFKKLDLNHIAFVIHGEKPLEPAPAGAYRDTASDGKSIYVVPAPYQQFPQPKLEVSLLSQENEKITLEVTNNGPTSYSGPLTITNGSVSIFQKDYLFAPLSNNQISLSLKNQIVSSQLIININGQTFDFSIQPIKARFSYFYFIPILVVIIALISWYLHIRRQKPQPPLHW